jgi:hypothetical protein
MRYQCKSSISAILVAGAFLSHSILLQAAEEKSLYERLGGYGVVSAVDDDFAGKLFGDPVVLLVINRSHAISGPDCYIRNDS